MTKYKSFDDYLLDFYEKLLSSLRESENKIKFRFFEFGKTSKSIVAIFKFDSLEINYMLRSYRKSQETMIKSYAIRALSGFKFEKIENNPSFLYLEGKRVVLSKINEKGEHEEIYDVKDIAWILTYESYKDDLFVEYEKYDISNSIDLLLEERKFIKTKRRNYL